MFLLVTALTAVLAAGAFALSSRRDLGAGLVPSRLGPAVAPRYLRTPLTLAWRLQRGTLIGWLVGFAAYGLLAGAVTQTAVDLVTGSRELADVVARLGGHATSGDLLMASFLNLGGLVAAGYAIAAGLRLRAEESSLHMEHVLATPVTRSRWAASHLSFALVGPAAALVAGGFAAGLVYGLDIGDVGGQLPRALAGAVVQLPAVWVLAGLTMAVYGALPRLAAPVSWVAFAWCALLGQVGALLNLSPWVLHLSPFTHIPHVPGGSVSATPLLVLTLIAVALVAVASFRTRDVPQT